MNLPVATPQDSASTEIEAVLELARSGTMPLPDLLTRTQNLAERGMAEASALLYGQWIAATQSPLRHVACFNWGTVLSNLNRDTEAETAYRQALQLQPGFAQALLNLGHLYERRNQSEEALAQWQLVLDHTRIDDANHLEVRLHAQNNLARYNEQLRRYDIALSHMTASLALKPDQPDVIQHLVHLRQKMCAWPVYAPVPGVPAVTPNRLLVGTSALAMLGATDDPALQLMAAMRFAYERVAKAPPTPVHASYPQARQGKIKIGYLSGDLHMHAVGLLSVEMLELHDHERFEVHAFCWGRDDGSALRARIVAALHRHHRIANISDVQAAHLIAGLGIDVLVDLQGLTSGARASILSASPAPVQVSYLGLPGTSAIPGVNYIVADRYVMPPELLPYCTEQPIYLPRCYQASDRQRPVGKPANRADCHLPQDAFVYCSFNNNFKFTEEMFRTWMRILQQVPSSVLWLLADNPWAQNSMLAQADAHGIARDRLVFADRAAPADYLARLALPDLFLDTFPYNAGTTANDVLWMGTPILTYSGRTYISRMAGSLLTHVGLPDLITESLAQYEQRAVQLGRNPARCQSYKRYLAEHGRASSLFDMPGFVRDIEAQYAQLALAARIDGHDGSA